MKAKLVPGRHTILELCRGKYVYDFGCGACSPEIAELLIRDIMSVAKSYHGFDLDPDGVACLKTKQFSVSVLDLDDPPTGFVPPTNLPGATDEVLLLFSEVIEHLPNPGKTLQWLSSWCREMNFSNPRILLGTPNVYSFAMTLWHWMTMQDSDSDTHLLRFSPKNLKALVERSSWTCIDWWFYYSDRNYGGPIPTSVRFLKMVIPRIIPGGAPGFLMLCKLAP